MTSRPISVNANFAFILLNVFIWLILGIIIAVDAHPALPDLPTMKGIMAALSMVIAVILLVLLIFLYRRKRIAYYLVIAFFAVTSLLTIFDEVGLSDLVVLGLNVIPIILLIKDRTWYLQPQGNANH